MTDQELDTLMRRVLLDSLKLDLEGAAGNEVPFEPTAKYQRQMTAMLADPLKWARNRVWPVWKKVIQKVAVILLVLSLSLGSLIAVSPTVRAAVIRWVTEWYETHIVYRFSGESNSGKIPEYKIAAIPEAFVETDRIEDTSSVSVFYEDYNGGVISYDYFYMQQGAATIVTTQENVVEVTVNGLQGQLFLPTEVKETTTIIWIDPRANIQFAIDTTLGKDVLMSMAESVSLEDITKK